LLCFAAPPSASGARWLQHQGLAGWVSGCALIPPSMRVGCVQQAHRMICRGAGRCGAIARLLQPGEGGRLGPHCPRAARKPQKLIGKKDGRKRQDMEMGGRGGAQGSGEFDLAGFGKADRGARRMAVLTPCSRGRTSFCPWGIGAVPEVVEVETRFVGIAWRQ